MSVEIHDRASEPSLGWFRVVAIEEETKIVAEVGFTRGQERYLAAVLHDLVAKSELDIRIVKHWFELHESKIKQPPGKTWLGKNVTNTREHVSGTVVGTVSSGTHDGKFMVYTDRGILYWDSKDTELI